MKILVDTSVWWLAFRRRSPERAAEFFNTCRAKGLQGSNTDFLLCAVSAGHRMPIFTTDDDFTRYVKVLPAALHRYTSG